ncbi:MAG: MFS transporter [Clostridia bacterium]|nr:MFS transporter [Clostridia bacterium]
MANYVFIMAPAIVLASVFTAIWGKAYDRLGFNRSVVPSVALLAVGYLLLFIFRNTAMVFFGSLFMMCGYLSGMAVFGAVIRDNIPKNKSGMFQGLRIVGQVLIPGVIGPFIGARILSGAKQELINGTLTFIPNKNIFLGALIVALALGVGLCLLFYFTKGCKNEKN